MLDVSKRKKGVTLGQWLPRGLRCKDVLTSTTHARVGDTTYVNAGRNRGYDSTKCFVCGKQGHKQRDSPQRRHSKARKGVHGQSHGQTRHTAATVHPRFRSAYQE